MSNCGYVTTPAVAANMMAEMKVANDFSPCWEGNMLEGRMAGFRAMSSNQMPAGTMLFGDFAQMIIAEWGVLEIDVNPYANFQAGIVGVRALATIDIGIRHQLAFSKAVSIT
jgi:Phage capsid family